jgi:ribosome recycling factor
MIDDVLKEADEKMKKAVVANSHELAAVRTGRASGAILEHLMINYYGSGTPLNQVATISAPEAQLVVVQPWDKTALEAVEKAIMQSDLGLTPSNDGNVIRVPFPPLSEERRKDLVKHVKKLAEEGRIAVRNIRRDANEKLKHLEKDHEISEDDGKRAHDQCQKMTDKHIVEIDALLTAKESEIMEV